jgi:hypothetical protein
MVAPSASDLSNRQAWQECLDQARQNMRDAPASHRLLIEVAAQHPLIDGTDPGPEFRARLDRGAELAIAALSAGWTVSVYVPGSRHQDGGRQDLVSLSSAGCEYLRSRLPEQVSLHGDGLNERYLPGLGVYGSSDECFVSASFFRDGHFHRILAVVSPQQAARKLLYYYAFGIAPELHTAPVDEPHHNLIGELWDTIPTILATDPSELGPDSPLSRKLRSVRKPDLH